MFFSQKKASQELRRLTETAQRKRAERRTAKMRDPLRCEESPEEAELIHQFFSLLMFPCL